MYTYVSLFSAISSKMGAANRVQACTKQQGQNSWFDVARFWSWFKNLQRKSCAENRPRTHVTRHQLLAQHCTVSINQGGKRLGDETSSPLFKGCVMQRRTGTSALSELPVRLVVGKIYLSTNQKSHFLSLFFSQPCTMIKTFFHSPGSQLKMLMSAWTLVKLFHSESEFPKNALSLRVSN